MKKIICLILSVLLCLSCFCGCQTAQPEAPETPTQPSTSTLPNRGRLSVLFIGNSYTYYHDMPTQIFDQIARAAGYEPNVISVTCGGYSLEQHADPQNTYGLKVASYLLPKNINMFDFVVMQEQSQRPAYNNRAPFYDAVRTISAKAQAINAKPILYSTWGRRSDSKDLKSMGLTNESMTWRLAAGYTAIGEELNIPVGHVGLAFYEVYTGNSGIELYDDDATHPSYAGSYLAAMTLFSKMTGIDPTTVDFVGELTEAEAAVLKQAAQNAVFNTPEIPEEYRTSSAGVTNSQ
jgi:hypothetical protein